MKEFRIDGSLDEYFDNVIEKYYKYDKKLIEITKDNLDDNKVDRPDSDDKPNKDDSKFQKILKMQMEMLQVKSLIQMDMKQQSKLM